MIFFSWILDLETKSVREKSGVDHMILTHFTSSLSILLLLLLLFSFFLDNGDCEFIAQLQILF